MTSSMPLVSYSSGVPTPTPPNVPVPNPFATSNAARAVPGQSMAPQVTPVPVGYSLAAGAAAGKGSAQLTQMARARARRGHPHAPLANAIANAPGTPAAKAAYAAAVRQLAALNKMAPHVKARDATAFKLALRRAAELVRTTAHAVFNPGGSAHPTSPLMNALQSAQVSAPPNVITPRAIHALRGYREPSRTGDSIVQAAMGRAVAGGFGQLTGVYGLGGAGCSDKAELGVSLASSLVSLGLNITGSITGKTAYSTAASGVSLGADVYGMSCGIVTQDSAQVAQYGAKMTSDTGSLIASLNPPAKTGSSAPAVQTVTSQQAAAQRAVPGPSYTPDQAAVANAQSAQQQAQYNPNSASAVSPYMAQQVMPNAYGAQAPAAQVAEAHAAAATEAAGGDTGHDTGGGDFMSGNGPLYIAGGVGVALLAFVLLK